MFARNEETNSTEAAAGSVAKVASTVLTAGTISTQMSTIATMLSVGTISTREFHC